MKSTKLIFAIAIVLLLSVFATSCIPTTPGENPMPDNSFRIGATYLFDINNSTTTGTEKTIVLDGDSLAFIMGYSHYPTDWNGVATFEYCCYMKINGVPIQSNTAGYTVIGNSYNIDFSTPFLGKLFDAGVTISDSYTDSLNSFSIPAIGYDNNIFLVQDSYIDGSIYDMFHFPINTDKYIVLRKIKPEGNQYYWIKFRREGTYFLKETITAVSGKYQMNSITTGQ